MTGEQAAIDMHELLAQQDFVRRLAHSLVFAEDRVEDAVQDAWVAALRNPPREKAAVATWFGRVLENLARRGARDAARRQRRERHAAKDEALPSTADVLAREQERQRVVDAVLALPEPYRATVLARFFDDLSPGEIARRRGVPAATVRSHLKRGLDLLRRRLDELHGGDRRAWLVALLPLARPLHTAGMGGLAALAGGMLVTKLFAVAGALALGLLGYLMWSQGPVATPPDRVEIARGELGAAAGGAEVAADAAAAGERTQVAPVAAPSAGADAAGHRGLAFLRGRVVHRDGAPAGNCQVRILGIDGLELFDAQPTGADRTLALRTATARTQLDGTFRIDGVWPRARYALHADVDGPDRTLRLLDVAPKPGAVTDLGDIVLTPKGRIVGRAVDEDGAPVAGAEVLALDLPAAFGALLPFDRLTPAQGGVLAVPDAAGLVASDAETATDLGDIAGYGERLRAFLGRELFMRSDLDRDASVTSLVVPELPWLQTAWRELPFARSTSDAEGHFELIGVEPGANVLIVRKTGLASGLLPRVPVEATATHDVGEVELPFGEEMLGVVQDHRGQAVPGAEVRVAPLGLLGYRGLAFCEAPVRTDAEGRLAAAGLPRGRALVAVRRSAADPWQLHGPVATDADVEIKLPAPQTLALQVVDAAGQPVPEPVIELLAGPPLGELARAGLQQQLPLEHRATRGDDGTIALGGLPPGCYTLRVGAATAAPRMAMVQLPRRHPLRLTLAASRTITVTARDAAGAPVADAKIYLQVDDAPEAIMPTSYGMARWRRPPQLSGRTDADGHLTITDVPMSGVEIVAMHAELCPAAHRLDEAATPKDPIELVLAPGATLHGKLFDHGLAADPYGWRVVAEPRGWGGPPMQTLTTRLRADSTYEFANLRAATYAIHAEPVADRPLSMAAFVADFTELVYPPLFRDRPREHQVTVECGGVETLDFDVAPTQPPPGVIGASLRGRVLVDGRPIAGKSVLQLRGDDSRFQDLTTIAADGSYAVASVAPGTAQLSLRVDGVSRWLRTVQLQSGADEVLNIEWNTASLRGRVTFAGAGFPVADYVVRASVQAGDAIVEEAARTDATGAFELTRLAAGTAQVNAFGPDGRAAPVEVELVAGDVRELVLTLAEAPVLSGCIDLGERRRNRGTMVFLKMEHSWYGTSLQDDGSFHFSNLERAEYELSLRIDGDEVELSRSKFDLRQQSYRDVLLTIVETGAGR